jgi:hypothetical protein
VPTRPHKVIRHRLIIEIVAFAEEPGRMISEGTLPRNDLKHFETNLGLRFPAREKSAPWPGSRSRIMTRSRIIVLMVVVLALVAIGHYQLARFSNTALNIRL